MGHDKVWQGQVRFGRWVKVRFGLAWFDEVWSGRYGMVRLCLVLEVGLGLAGTVRHG